MPIGGEKSGIYTGATRSGRGHTGGGAGNTRDTFPFQRVGMPPRPTGGGPSTTFDVNASLLMQNFIMNDDDKRWWAELQQKYAEDFLDPEGHAPDEIHVPNSMGQTHKVDALHGESVELLRRYIQEAVMKKCKKHGNMSVCEQCGECCDCKKCSCGSSGGKLLKTFINEAIIDEDEEEDDLPETDEMNVVANIAGYTGPLGMGSPPYVDPSGSAKKGTPPWNKRGPSKGKRGKKKK